MLIECAQCGAAAEKPDKEIRRQKKNGQARFFCSPRCSSRARAAERPDRRVALAAICGRCGRAFEGRTGARAPRFCWRGCASAGSVTPHRRARAREQALSRPFTPEARAAALRSKEGWKYARVGAALVERGEAHAFELLVGDSIFDLALTGRRLLVEFDGKDHRTSYQAAIDAHKDEAARALGWSVARVPVEPNTVIEPGAVLALLLS